MDTDRLVARLTQAQDTIRYQEATIQQLQADGFVHVQPQLMADTMLAAGEKVLEMFWFLFGVF